MDKRIIRNSGTLIFFAQICTFEQFWAFIMKPETEVLFMREQTYHIYLDSHQKTTLLNSLIELKNQLIQQGRYTDCVRRAYLQSHKCSREETENSHNGRLRCMIKNLQGL